MIPMFRGINHYNISFFRKGFVDFILQRPRSFSVVATKDALIAKFHRSGLDELKAKNPDLDRIVDKVLLLCSVVELASHDP